MKLDNLALSELVDVRRKALETGELISICYRNVKNASLLWCASARMGISRYALVRVYKRKHSGNPVGRRSAVSSCGRCWTAAVVGFTCRAPAWDGTTQMVPHPSEPESRGCFSESSGARSFCKYPAHLSQSIHETLSQAQSSLIPVDRE
jgi:hypothetical protein